MLCLYPCLKPGLPIKSAYLKIIFSSLSNKTYVVGTQMANLNEMVLLNTQNTSLNRWIRK